MPANIGAPVTMFEDLDSAMPKAWTSSTVTFFFFAFVLLLLPVLVDTWSWLIHAAAIFSSRDRSPWSLFHVVSDDSMEALPACDSLRSASYRSSALHLTLSESRYSLKLIGEYWIRHPPKTELLLNCCWNGRRYFHKQLCRVWWASLWK